MAFLQIPIKKIEILGIRVDDISDAAFEEMVRAWVGEATTHTVLTPNPEFVLLASKRGDWVQTINRASLSLPDGVGLQFASVALTGEIIEHRQTGVDAIGKVMRVLAERSGRVLLVGDDVNGKYGLGALSRAREALTKQFPALTFESVDPGRLEQAEYPEALARQAAEHEYAAVLVALPMPIQLSAMRAHEIYGYHGIVMGLGGALDMIAGTSPRAPKLWRKVGFEWLWRFLQEPSRYKRMYRALVVFPAKIAYATWERKQFLKASSRVFKYLFTGSYVRH